MKKTLKISQAEQDTSTLARISIFEVDPAEEDAILDTENSFDCWKGWRKVSARFYEDSTMNENMVHGPYFLRAAQAWRNILVWCDDSTSQPIGSIIRESLVNGHKGMKHKEWERRHRRLNLKNSKIFWACQAIYAFSGGQNRDLEESFFYGLFGGYCAYDFYSCTSLERPMSGDSPHQLEVAICRFTPDVGKGYIIDFEREAFIMKTHENEVRAVNWNSAPAPDDFLSWFEEHGMRLKTGLIGAGVMGSHPNDPPALTVYPRLPLSDRYIVTEGEQLVSRAVTRGVEVVASAVRVPQAGRGQQMGFIYSIRIRLLTRNEPGYVPPSERGFETCQLFSRHWRITNHSTGRTDVVDGEGVIGMFPILREGGYMERRQEYSGTFQYQSCSGPMESGAFQGHVRFIPGSIQNPTGQPFDVAVSPFALQIPSDFIY